MSIFYTDNRGILIVHADLDNRSRREDIVFFFDKVSHDGVFFIGLHLPMEYAYISIWEEHFEFFCGLMDRDSLDFITLIYEGRNPISLITIIDL